MEFCQRLGDSPGIAGVNIGAHFRLPLLRLGLETVLEASGELCVALVTFASSRSNLGLPRAASETSQNGVAMESCCL